MPRCFLLLPLAQMLMPRSLALVRDLPAAAWTSEFAGILSHLVLLEMSVDFSFAM